MVRPHHMAVFLVTLVCVSSVSQGFFLSKLKNKPSKKAFITARLQDSVPNFSQWQWYPIVKKPLTTYPHEHTHFSYPTWFTDLFSAPTIHHRAYGAPVTPPKQQKVPDIIVGQNYPPNVHS